MSHDLFPFDVQGEPGEDGAEGPSGFSGAMVSRLVKGCSVCLAGAGGALSVLVFVHIVEAKYPPNAIKTCYSDYVGTSFSVTTRGNSISENICVCKKLKIPKDLCFGCLLMVKVGG